MSGIFINVGSVQRYGGRLSSLSRAITAALSVFAGAAAVYALRIPAGSTYNGPLVRVRRSSDNTEQDIGADAFGNLDVFSLGRHVRAQNLTTQSSTPVNAIWGTVGGTKTAGQVAPDGSTDAVLFTGNGISGAHRINNETSISYAAGTTYSLSYYVRPGTETFVQLTPPSAAFGATAYCNFQLTGAGVVGNNAGLAGPATIQALPDGYYRISISVTAAATTSASTAILFLVTSLTAGRAESNTKSTSVAIWGSQASVSTIPLLYSPTTTSTIATSESGFVSVWYESRNGRHIAQTATGSQPRIVNAGVLDSINGRPSIYFDGGNKFLFNSLPFAFSQGKSTVSAVTSSSPASSAALVCEGLSSSAQPIYNLIAGGSGVAPSTMRAIIRNTSGVAVLSLPDLALNAFLGTPSIVSVVDSGDLVTGFLNGATGSSVAYTRTGAYNFDRFSIGARLTTGVTNPWTGFVSEVVFVDSSAPATRQTIERNQGAYYGITVA